MTNPTEEQVLEFYLSLIHKCRRLPNGKFDAITADTVILQPKSQLQVTQVNFMDSMPIAPEPFDHGSVVWSIFYIKYMGFPTPHIKPPQWFDATKHFITEDSYGFDKVVETIDTLKDLRAL